MRMARSVAKMILMTVVVAVLPTQAGAECVATWKDISDAKRQAALVFSGTVTELKPDPDGLFVVFAVDRAWKGSPRRRLVLPLWTASIESFVFQKGEAYLVFADRHQSSRSDPLSMRVPTISEPVFKVSTCSATRALSTAQTALAQLGRGSK